MNANAQRQAALRARRAAEGRTEVRGIYARPEHHAQIKRYADRLARLALRVKPE